MIKRNFYYSVLRSEKYILSHRTSVVRVFSASRHFFKTNVTESDAEFIFIVKNTKMWSFSNKFGELRCKNVNNTFMQKPDFA